MNRAAVPRARRTGTANRRVSEYCKTKSRVIREIPQDTTVNATEPIVTELMKRHGTPDSAIRRGSARASATDMHAPGSCARAPSASPKDRTRHERKWCDRLIGIADRGLAAGQRAIPRSGAMQHPRRALRTNEAWRGIVPRRSSASRGGHAIRAACALWLPASASSSSNVQDGVRLSDACPGSD